MFSNVAVIRHKDARGAAAKQLRLCTVDDPILGGITPGGCVGGGVGLQIGAQTEPNLNAKEQQGRSCCPGGPGVALLGVADVLIC